MLKSVGLALIDNMKLMAEIRPTTAPADGRGCARKSRLRSPASLANPPAAEPIRWAVPSKPNEITAKQIHYMGG